MMLYFALITFLLCAFCGNQVAAQQIAEADLVENRLALASNDYAWLGTTTSLYCIKRDDTYFGTRVWWPCASFLPRAVSLIRGAFSALQQRCTTRPLRHIRLTRLVLYWEILFSTICSSDKKNASASCGRRTPIVLGLLHTRKRFFFTTISTSVWGRSLRVSSADVFRFSSCFLSPYQVDYLQE